MSDPVTPLNGAHFDGFVTVREIGPQGMITLRGDLQGDALREIVKTIAGVDMPGPLRIAKDARGCAWMSPDELLLLLPRPDVAGALETIANALEGTHHLAADVSDARAMFRVTGPQARDVLAKLTPADVSPAAMPAGTLRRTRLAQVPAALWLDDDETAYIICFRSVAQYVFDLLSVSAKPGSAPGLFASAGN